MKFSFFNQLSNKGSIMIGGKRVLEGLIELRAKSFAS